MKYIDADKLIAEIKRLRKGLPDSIEHLNDEERGFARGQQYELTAIEEEILYIQQEQLETDLEKEIEERWQNWVSPPRNEYAVFNKEEFINIVRHFYELGFNASKEPSEVDIVMEYDEYFDSVPVYGKLVNRNAGIAIARHFWNKGYNARKEE